MRIPDEIIRQLHEINCEDAAKRFGLDVKNIWLIVLSIMTVLQVLALEIIIGNAFHAI